MITFISGVPGSGKTYLAVTMMKNDKLPIHTNIEIKKDIKVDKFEWRSFYEKLTFLYAFKENPDQAIEEAKKLGIFGISIYYDECHLELANQDKIVIWWLSWHRHLSQSIVLITQSKATLAQKYRAYPEIFVDAHPASKRIFGSVMRYTEFASYRMSKDDVIRKYSIKIDPKIFDLYRTGQANKGTSSLRKKLYLIVGFFAVPILAFYLILNKFSPDPIEEEVIAVENNVSKVKKVVQPIIEKVKVSKPVVVEVMGEWVNYKGWFFSIDHTLIKKLFTLPHKTHRIASTYTLLQFPSKYEVNFEKLVEYKLQTNPLYKKRDLSPERKKPDM